ncbi:MAG: ubiquitin-like domain-containing protein [Mycobacteriales bacterium]
MVARSIFPAPRRSIFPHPPRAIFSSLPIRRSIFSALVLALLLGSASAWLLLEKTVTVEVDGQPRAVRTFAGTVGQTLDRLELHAGPHDVLAPAANVSVHDGSRIVLRRGRELVLTVNGRRRTVWVTALSVQEALDQLGIRASANAYLSASRSRPLPASGLSMELRLPVRVRLVVGGTARTVTTTAPTVRGLLHDAKVAVGVRDNVSLPLTMYPREGMVVKVTRVVAGRREIRIEIPRPTVRRPDASLYRGTTRVVVEGSDGIAVKVYAAVYSNGKLAVQHFVYRKVELPPQARVLAYGTKPRPSHSASPDGLNWAALARCESGGNPRAVSRNGTYRGLYQFSMSTWHGVGGVGDPIDASPSEQTYRAQILYRRAGRSPWPVCGRYL